MDYLVVYRTKRKLNAEEKTLKTNAENMNVARTNALKRIGYKNTIISIKMEVQNV